MRIYLDNCCFNRPFDDQNQVKINAETQAKLYIQEKILRNVFDLCWSFMLDYENNDNPFENRKLRIGKWRDVAKHNCNMSNDYIEKKAEQLQAVGLRKKDAVHLSCAIHSNCDYFITTDMGILKRNLKEITIVDPLEFIRRLEQDHEI